MKKILSIALLGIIVVTVCSCGSESNKNTNNTKPDQQNQEQVVNEKVQYLTTQAFIEKVYDYKTNKEWVFKGDKPTVIDFYATWCKPCQRVAPIMEELAGEYEGKVNFYKVDTDKEQELAAYFNIQSIPSMMFIPMQGKPSMNMGAMPKEEYVKLIDAIIVK